MEENEWVTGWYWIGHSWRVHWRNLPFTISSWPTSSYLV